MKHLFKKIISAAILGGMVLASISVSANPAAGADGGGVGNGDLTGDGDVPVEEPTNVRDDVSIPQLYPAFEVVTSDDIFVNPEIFTVRTGGMQFVDNNADGIVDIAQDSVAFAELKIGLFVDANHDTIYDGFQTFEFYKTFQINNYVDVDGDGLCDNYEQNPWVN